MGSTRSAARSSAQDVFPWARRFVLWAVDVVLQAHDTERAGMESFRSGKRDLRHALLQVEF
jgi:hypothetical protein